MTKKMRSTYRALWHILLVSIIKRLLYFQSCIDANALVVSPSSRSFVSRNDIHSTTTSTFASSTVILDPPSPPVVDSISKDYDKSAHIYTSSLQFQNQTHPQEQIIFRMTIPEDLNQVSNILSYELAKQHHQRHYTDRDQHEASTTASSTTTSIPWSNWNTAMKQLKAKVSLQEQLQHRLHAINAASKVLRNYCNKYNIQDYTSTSITSDESKTDAKVDNHNTTTLANMFRHQKMACNQILWSNDEFRHQLEEAVRISLQYNNAVTTTTNSNRNDSNQPISTLWDNHNFALLPSHPSMLNHIMITAISRTSTDTKQSNRHGGEGEGGGRVGSEKNQNDNKSYFRKLRDGVLRNNNNSYYSNSSSDSRHPEEAVIGFCEIAMLPIPNTARSANRLHHPQEVEEEEITTTTVEPLVLFAPCIMNLVISPEYRRRGIAKRFIKTVARYVKLNWFSSDGYDGCELSSSSSLMYDCDDDSRIAVSGTRVLGLYVDQDNDAAKALYQQHGFTSVHQRGDNDEDGIGNVNNEDNNMEKVFLQLSL